MANQSEQFKTHETGAVRSTDADHVRFDLISPIGLQRLAETYAEGAEKYDEHNWRKGFKFSVLLNHAIRHIYLRLQGDTSEDHLAHAAWNLFALMEFDQTRPELNDLHADQPTVAAKQPGPIDLCDHAQECPCHECNADKPHPPELMEVWICSTCDKEYDRSSHHAHLIAQRGYCGKCRSIIS